MLDDMPDDPLAGEGVFLPFVYSAKDVFQVGRCPARKTALDELHRSLKPIDQFRRSANRLPLSIPRSHRCDILVSFTHQVVKPAHPDSNDVRQILTNRAQAWRGAKGKLLLR